MPRTDTLERAIVSAAVLPEEREALEQLAAAADRSLSAEIRRALRQYLERTDTEREEPDAATED